MLRAGPGRPKQSGLTAPCPSLPAHWRRCGLLYRICSMLYRTGRLNSHFFARRNPLYLQMQNFNPSIRSSRQGNCQGSLATLAEKKPEFSQFFLVRNSMSVAAVHRSGANARACLYRLGLFRTRPRARARFQGWRLGLGCRFVAFWSRMDPCFSFLGEERVKLGPMCVCVGGSE